MKTINIIVYLPGYAGNFLQLLLSLDPSTYPWMPEETQDPNKRKNSYSFKGLQNKESIWASHHIQLNWPMNKFIQDQQEKFKNVVVSIHPNDFYKVIDQLQANDIRINYLGVQISDAAKTKHIDEFKERNGGFPHLREGDIENYERFKKEFNPFMINLDMIFLTETEFVDEYIRVCEHLSLTPQYSAAIEFYQEWREARSVDRTTIYSPNEIIDKTTDLLKNFLVKNSMTAKFPELFEYGASGRS